MTSHSTPPSRPAIRRRLVIGISAVAVAAVIAVATLTAISGDSTDSNEAAGGSAAPAVSFERFDGSTATLADYRGQPLVVNFWASWCPSCVAEMSSAFLPAQLSLGDRVAFLGINTQDERSRALELVEKTGVLFDLAEDRRGDLYSALGGLGMPFTVFVDSTGSVVHSHNGPVTEQQLTDLISEHLLS